MKRISRFISKHLIGERRCSPECIAREDAVMDVLDTFSREIATEAISRMKDELPVDPNAPPLPEEGCQLSGKDGLCRYSRQQVKEFCEKIIADRFTID